MKNKKIVKLLSLILAMLMMAAVFASCNKSEEGTEDTTAAAGENGGDEGKTPAQLADPFTADTPGVIDLTEYTIIRPAETSSDDTKAITQFRNYVNSFCGTKIAAKADTVADKDGKEILIGLTNRKASKDAAKGLKARDWSVSVDGNKVVVLAGSEASFANATNWIIENSLQEGNKYAKIGDGTSYKHDYSASDLKAGDTVLESINIGFINKDNVGYVDSALVFADNLKLNAGVSSTLGTYGTLDGFTILVASYAQGAKYLPAGVVLGPNQYIICRHGDNIAVVGYEETGAEIGTQTIIRAIQNANKEALDLYSLCKDEVLTYTFGGDNAIDLTLGAEYRIMTYNVLRELGHSGTGGERYNNAIRVIKHYNPDVIGFEEYCPKYTEMLTPMLVENGYTVLGDDMPEVQADTFNADKNNFTAKHNYTPLAFKTEKFNLLASGWQRLYERDSDQVGNYGWPGYTVTWAVLEDKTTGDVFGVTTTHNVASGNEEKDVTDRIEGINKIIGIVRENIIANYECPVFCVGDYNTNETNNDYRVYLEVQDPAFADARYVAKRGYASGATTHELGAILVAGDASSTIDHIFVSGAATVLRHRFATITDAALGGDHYPVFVDVVIG